MTAVDLPELEPGTWRCDVCGYVGRQTTYRGRLRAFLRHYAQLHYQEEVA